mgnify:FL=1
MSSRRPTQVPRWAWGVSATLVQPPTLSAENGFAAAQRPPAPWFNWQLNALGAWIDFLRSPNVEAFARTAWATSPGVYDSSSPVLLAVDASTVDATGAAYRMVIAGWETSGPTTSLQVSQTGNAWTRRTNLPGGIGKPTALAHLDCAAKWVLADDAPALWYAPHDAGGGTSPVGGSSSGWVSCSGTSDDGSGGLTAIKAIASNTYKALAITTAGGLYSADGAAWAAITEGTARSGNGLDVVWDGANFVYVTSDGEIYASPTADGSFALKSTLPDGAADWRLAAGDTGDVLAYQHNHGSVTSFYRSTNSGTSWSTITPVEAGGRSVLRFTCVRWRDGVWMATSSVAPFLWTSNDGTNWHALRPDVSGAGALAAIAWDGRAWVAAGNGFVVRCPPGADPATGDYVADSEASTLADAGTLRGRRITTGSPSDGDTLVWDAGTSTWVYGAGGGGSLPVADPAGLLSGATASRIVGTDGSGNGTLLTAAQAAALLGVTSRRPAATAATRLLYELTETSGNAINTGSLASADLNEIGSSVVRAADLESVWGGSVVMPGDSNSYIRGAAGVAPTSTTQLTMWCLAKIRSDPAARKSIFTRDHATWGGYPYISAALVAAPSGAWYVEIGRVSPGYTEFHATTNYALNKLHLFGLTYDGTTLRAWLDGAAAGSASAAGEINWGPGTGKWELGSNGGGERPVATLYRAGVEEAVWGADAWASFYAKLRGIA